MNNSIIDIDCFQEQWSSKWTVGNIAYNDTFCPTFNGEQLAKFTCKHAKPLTPGIYKTNSNSKTNSSYETSHIFDTKIIFRNHLRVVINIITYSQPLITGATETKKPLINTWILAYPGSVTRLISAGAHCLNTSSEKPPLIIPGVAKRTQGPDAFIKDRSNGRTAISQPMSSKEKII